jgi:hypothetical protein
VGLVFEEREEVGGCGQRLAPGSWPDRKCGVSAPGKSKTSRNSHGQTSIIHRCKACGNFWKSAEAASSPVRLRAAARVITGKTLVTAGCAVDYTMLAKPSPAGYIRRCTWS